MGQWTEEASKTKAPVSEPVPFPRMLSLEQVQEVLSLGMPSIYALVKSGELRAGQFGGRNVWRVSEDDLAAYIDAVYAKTAASIASGQIAESDVNADKDNLE